MEPTLSLVEAVARTGRSRAHLQRLAVAGRIEGATKGKNGWRLPISGLIAAGETVHDTPVGRPDEQVVELRRQLDDARAEAQRHRERVEVAERIETDLRDRIVDLRREVDDLRATVEFERRQLLTRNPAGQGERSSPWATSSESVDMVVEDGASLIVAEVKTPVRRGWRPWAPRHRTTP